MQNNRETVGQVARLLLSLGNGDYPMTQNKLSGTAAHSFSADLAQLTFAAQAMLLKHELVHQPGKLTVPTPKCIELAQTLACSAQKQAHTAIARAAEVAWLFAVWLESQEV